MCFYSSESAKQKIAKTDIECWKVLKKPKDFEHFNGFESQYQKFIYEKNVVTDSVKLVKYCEEIEEGYHSYRSIKRAKAIRSFSTDRHVICKFVIPAGTHYYSNIFGEYVSERIMLIEEVVEKVVIEL
jgi:hypothetical protein